MKRDITEYYKNISKFIWEYEDYYKVYTKSLMTRNGIKVIYIPFTYKNKRVVAKYGLF